MEKQIIKINGISSSIPAYYQKIDPMPGDPENSVPYVVQTENAGCIVFISTVDHSHSLPRRKEDLLGGIRQYLADNQGIINVTVQKDYVYSIVKNLKEPSGVQYILTFQAFYDDTILNIQGYFDEIGMNGVRDSMVYALIRNEKSSENDEDPFSGWSADPYDDSIKKGALMNVSEQERFDELFPGFPLSMCREFVRCLIENYV